MQTKEVIFCSLSKNLSTAILGRCRLPKGQQTCSSPMKPVSCGFSKPTRRKISTKLLLARVLASVTKDPSTGRSCTVHMCCAPQGRLGHVSVCKQVVGVTSKNLKKALQQPCKSTGRQVGLSFASTSQVNSTSAQPARVLTPLAPGNRQVDVPPPVEPGPSAEAAKSVTTQQRQGQSASRPLWLQGLSARFLSLLLKLLQPNPCPSLALSLRQNRNLWNPPSALCGFRLKQTERCRPRQ